MAGNLKMTMPTAFTTAMLAWGLVSFRDGYSKQAGAIPRVDQQIVWGADYLLKLVSSSSPSSFSIIYQVR